MRVVGLPSAFYQILRHPPPELSDKARERLRALCCWQTLREQGLTVRLWRMHGWWSRWLR